ncbi:decarboxylase [Streptomyces sp. NPDC057638]|uniref:maleate cis-trans isomerase family protein n=1 Tax=Streptomyces sp. NPDC057638 TaxID=3346190 RepID=UPI0036C29FD9
MTTVGLLSPGHTAEDEFPRLEVLLDSDIRLPAVTLDAPVGFTADVDGGEPLLGPPGRLAPALEELRLAGADSVVWTCDGDGFGAGWARTHEALRALARTAGVPASNTAVGFVNAARKLGAERVAVAATYPAEVTEGFTEFLRAGGVEVVGTASAGVRSAADTARWGGTEVLDLARSADRPEAGAVLLPDSALHTVAHLPELEEALGKPVLTASQVSVWEGLRLTDRRAWAPKLGTLFARPPYAS